MVFQYNPFFHHIETNGNRELLFTVARHGTISPKVRYNPHDEGGVLRDDALPSDRHTSLHCGLFRSPHERTDPGEVMTRRSE